MEENEIEESPPQQSEPLFKLLSDSSSTDGANAPNPKYEDGKVLPKKLRARFLQEAKPCVPLEEIDPYFRNKHTFIAVGRWGTLHRFSCNPDSYGTLSPENGFRRFAIYLLTNWIFSTFIVATLLLNCVALLKTQSYEITNHLTGTAGKITWVEDTMYIVNYVCLAIYCVELVLKIFGRGLVGDGFSCFRDPWSWLDLLVIWTGFFPYYVFILHKKAAVWIRLFKIIPLVPSIRQAGKLSLKAVRRLGGMLILLALLLWFFALLGSQMYMGTLTQKCIKKLPEQGISHDMWNMHNTNDSNWFRDDYDYVQCGNASGTRQCPENYVCVQGYGKSPDGGYTNFDNVLWSLLSVVRIASEDFTEEIFRQVLETNGSFHIVFFVAIFFLITYPMGCLFFAILGHFFTESKAPAELEMEELTALADVHDFDNGSQNPESLELKGKKMSTSEDLVGFRKSLHSFIFHDYVRSFLIFVILVDIFSVISDYYGIESNVVNYRLHLRIIPYIVLFLYFSEFIVKLIALGPLPYFKNRWNQLDVVIILTFFLEAQSYFGTYNGYMLAPIRMLKLIQYWPSLRMIFAVYFKTIRALSGWVLYTFIVFAFIVCIGPFELGQYERERFRSGSGRMLSQDFHRWSFIDFWHSFRTVVRMQIAEWVETLWVIHPYAGASTFVFYLAANLSGAILVSFILIGIVHSTINELQSNYDPSKERGLRLLLRKTFGMLYSPIKRIQPRELVMKNGANDEGSAENEGEEAEKEKSEENEKEEKGEVVKSKKSMVSESTNQLRKVMQDCTEHLAYKIAVCGIIIIASLAMIFEDKHAGDGLQTGLFVIEILFTAAFCIITIYELISFGFKESILNRGWLFDVIIVLENIINLSYYRFSVTGPFLVGLFCLRSFRPLMLISRVPWLRAPFRGLKQEVKTVWETVLAIMFIWLVFDAFGVHWLAGQYHKCIDNRGDEAYPTLSKEECLANNFTWENAVFNFDNAGDGFLNMVFLASRMGWVSIINDGSDATGQGNARQRDATKLWFFYFIIFVLLGGLGALGILFSYVFNKFQEDKGYNLILTKAQATAYSDAKNSEKPKKTYISLEDDYVPRPPAPFLRTFYNFVTNPKFDAVVMSLILIDNVCLSLDHYAINDTFDMVLGYVRLAILVLFAIEMVVKIIAWGKHYFMNAWNYLDMIVVVTGIFGFFFSDIVESYFVSPSFIRIFRLVRVFRFLLARRYGCQTAKILLSSVVNIRHAFGNLLLLHITIMWAYALLGHYLFRNVVRNGVLNDVINFETFQHALWTMILLLGFPCLDGLYVGLNNEFDCNVKDPETHTCGDKTAAVLYIGSYAALTFLILLNMYAVLIAEIISEIGRFKNYKKSNDVPLEDVSSERPSNNGEISELLEDGEGKGKSDNE